jgi:hypothetical protein
MKKPHPAAELFPLMEGDELTALVEDIEANGLREPVWLDKSGRILDGRNRARACEKLGKIPDYRTYEGDDPWGFSVSENMARRHLDESQRAMVAAKLVNTEPHRPKKSADLRTFSQPDAARRFNISERMVSSAVLLWGTAPRMAEEVWSGKVKLSRAERLLRDKKAQDDRIEEAKRAAEPFGATADIRHGDFREVLSDLEGIDAIITDPPYPQEFLPLLDYLAAWADKVLTDDGVLAVLIGQTHLPEVYRRLDGHRPYRWTGCYLTEGAGYVSHPRKVQSNWKPLIVYGGGPRFSDVIRSEGSDAKVHHKWGQDFAAFQTIIERLTKPGQTVCDPFMGSGTTLLAARALGRHAIGADVDLEAVETARERLA